MGPVAINPTSLVESVTQLLDEHHLVVLSDSPSSRRRFEASLIKSLVVLPQTQVTVIDGSACRDLPSFSRELESRLPARRMRSVAWWRDLHCVVDLLRTTRSGLHRRYLVWRDADVMLESDIELFGRLLNAVFAVAAESEYVSLDPVVLHRAILLGGPKLGAYAEDSAGQLNRWRMEESGPSDDAGESPFWEVANIVERPPVLTYRLDG